MAQSPPATAIESGSAPEATGRNETLPAEAATVLWLLSGQGSDRPQSVAEPSRLTVRVGIGDSHLAGGVGSWGGVEAAGGEGRRCDGADRRIETGGGDVH